MLLWLLAGCSAMAAAPRRVLLINSFGSKFSPFEAFSGSFRTELIRASAEPVQLQEVYLDSARFVGAAEQGAFAGYLQAMFKDRDPDLVVPVGGAAVRFAQAHRSQLFPGKPMLLTGADYRHVEESALTSLDAVATVRIDLVGALDGILQLLPGTTNVCVVLGDSPLERFWETELQQAVLSFTNRVQFDWVNRYSYARMLQHCATLPPRSAIFFGMLAVDAEGVSRTEPEALAGLRQSANAPIFGLFDTQLGQGIVGGRLLNIEELGRSSAGVAARLLEGEPPATLRPSPQAPQSLRFDDRELRQWGISASVLPAGSRVEFLDPAVGTRRGWVVVAVVVVCLAEAALIAALLVSLASWRRAEARARDLSTRLIHAQEQERARLARELHDDITQRLARLAIDAGQLERTAGAAAPAERTRQMRVELVRLSEDVHTLSYRLHPSLLEDLGLPAALRAECERFAERESIPAAVKLADVPERVPPDAALGLFRVLQESLRNVARHARAKTVEVSLRGLEGGLQLAVCDDGVGFDPRGGRNHATLGIASMRERMRLLAGELEIDTEPGHGTTILAWVPLKKGTP